MGMGCGGEQEHIRISRGTVVPPLAHSHGRTGLAVRQSSLGLFLVTWLSLQSLQGHGIMGHSRAIYFYVVFKTDNSLCDVVVNLTLLKSFLWPVNHSFNLFCSKVASILVLCPSSHSLARVIHSGFTSFVRSNLRLSLSLVLGPQTSSPTCLAAEKCLFQLMLVS